MLTIFTRLTRLQMEVKGLLTTWLNKQEFDLINELTSHW